MAHRRLCPPTGRQKPPGIMRRVIEKPFTIRYNQNQAGEYPTPYSVLRAPYSPKEDHMASATDSTSSPAMAPSRRLEVLAFVERTSGQDVRACYQCAKCAAGCPLVSAMDLSPPQIIRALQLGQPELALGSDTLWLCVGCHTCVTRCPCEIDLPRIVDSLRVWADAHEHAYAQSDILTFHHLFLKSIALTGRMYEIGLMGGFNLLSRNLFNNTDLALPMLRRGKVKAVPQRVQALDEISGIFQRAETLRRADEATAHPDRAGGGQ